MSDLETWNGDLWPRGMTPECLVTDGDEFLFETDYATAGAWIADTLERQERLGLPKGHFGTIPVRGRPGGVDHR